MHGAQVDHRAELRVRAAVPLTCLVYLEPDIDRAASRT
jgi:hypothetical protein